MGPWSRVVEAIRRPVREQLHAEQATADLFREERDELRESLRELVPDEIGWQKLLGGDVDEFTADERRRIRSLCRLMAIKNPLIKRGLGLRYVYVHGRGVQVSAKATGQEGEQDVNAVLQAFFDDPINADVIGQQAAEVNERTLGTDGGLLFALWTAPTTGAVRIRKLPVDEVREVITNPDDAAETWFYHRVWTRTTFDSATGRQATEQREAYYPDVHYTPRQRLSAIGGVPVVWDAPVAHLKVNSPDGWQFGIPDAFAACDWALAYKTFLEDWARLCRSLSRYAWKASGKGKSSRDQIRTKVTTPPSTDGAGRANSAGATVTLDENVTLEAVPKTGATLDSESGRPLAAMVAAALDLPVTMLLGDPGVTGARATAETLDDPLRLGMEARRDVWEWLYTVICNYVIDQAVRAPKGPLKGTISRNEYDREVVVLDGPGPDGTDRSLDITWPDLSKVDPVSMIQAIATADGTRTIPPLLIARMILEVLGRRDIDEILDELTDDQGNFLWPETAPNALGQQAVDAQRAGADPANTGTGTMAPPDDQQAEPPPDGNQGKKA